MYSNESYALLIGVDDYEAFDESLGHKAGTSNLRGSVNDAKMFYRLCRLLGIQKSHIRVLVSSDVAAFQGLDLDHVGHATYGEIVEGVAWLAKMLGQRSRPTGLMTYSGHGDWLADQGLVLCPSDVTVKKGTVGTDVKLVNAVPFTTLNNLLEEHDADENLTVVLDTCHSGGGTAVPISDLVHKSGKGLALTMRPLSTIAQVAKKATREPRRLGGRVLAATKRDEVAFQSMFDGDFHGLFSWAIAAAMEQWRRVWEGHDNVRLTVSYDKLLETAHRLMSGLWFGQTPELMGPAGVGKLAVLQRGLRPEPTSPMPDGGFKSEEIDPGYANWRTLTIAFNDAASTQLATMYLFPQAFGAYQANTEYWWVNLGVVSLLGHHSLNIQTDDHQGTQAPSAPVYASTQSWSWANLPGWGVGWGNDPLQGRGYLHAGPTGTSWLRIQRSAVSPFPVTNIAWYQASSSPTPGNIKPGGLFSGVANVGLPNGTLGYDINQTVP